MRLRDNWTDRIREFWNNRISQVERDFRKSIVQDPAQTGAALRSGTVAQICIEPDFGNLTEQRWKKSLWVTCSNCSFHVNSDEGLEEEVSKRKCKC